MSFCALCTSEDGPFVTRPLGRNNALVRVCAGCDDDARLVTPRGPEVARSYPERSRNAVKAAAAPSRPWRKRYGAPIGHARIPGWELIRIAKLDGRGGMHDENAARELIKDDRKPLAKIYACTDLEFVFQVPPRVDLGAGANDNALDSIEQFRSKG